MAEISRQGATGQGALAALVAAGLAAISLGYGFGYDFVCRASLPGWLCQGLSMAVPRALCAAALAAMAAGLNRTRRAELAQMLRPCPPAAALAALAAGFLLILLPLAVLQLSGRLLPLPGMLAAWAAGAALAAAGIAAALFDPRAARPGALRRLGPAMLLATGFGAVLPDLALALQPLWKVSAVTDATFASAVALLHLLGQAVSADPAAKAIMIDGFGVRVGPQCSGVEGFALVSVFTLFYLGLFRSQLRLGRAWLLLPAALVLSWGLNVARIAALMLLGRHVSPELAVNGFHSQAGWLAFLALALGIALAAHRIGWFQQEAAPAAAPRPAFFEDAAVAMILPFAVFMATASLMPAIARQPELLYPLRAGLTAWALWLCRRPLARLCWRADPLALAAGLAVGLLWIATAPAAGPEDLALRTALGALPGPVLLGWAMLRLAGTALLVPLVEELFFRGYLQQRLALGAGPLWRWGGVAAAALAFGLLHDRLAAGALAGLAFGAIALRRSGTGGAIQAHAAANAAIAAAAALSGDWHLI
ncbi:exosortase E/protease, VPEID-CTERM system [Poseidonocella sp. HB161398]|uniref:exosortase E/protease, VPEID-CTERM system n=1 Tax=Poseidonocella sp. HB161398 TaxID=2320855 RepID=UPI001107B916|nr:exosortase E/protease, VPEID-CTERM system [Poseidonocella sp. HB161398]